MTALNRLNAEIRSRFPALARKHNGQPAVFFDGPAGTQVPQSVIDAIASYLREKNANHGGAYATSIESDAMLHEAHRALADPVLRGRARRLPAVHPRQLLPPAAHARLRELAPPGGRHDSQVDASLEGGDVSGHGVHAGAVAASDG